MARALIRAGLERGSGRGERWGEKRGAVVRRGAAAGKRRRSWGGKQASCRVDQGLDGSAAGGGYHDTKKGGTDVAFDFTDILNGIRPHHVRVFVSVYHRPLCRAPTGPLVCLFARVGLSRAKTRDKWL